MCEVWNCAGRPIRVEVSDVFLPMRSAFESLGILAMRHLPFVFGFMSCCVSTSVVRAAEVSEEVAGGALPAPIVVTPELVEAHHAYQLAQLRLQQYRFVELPRQRQLLDGQVQLSESGIRVLRRRLRDYRPFLQVGRYSPVRTAAENDRLALEAAELELKLLRTERINLMRFSRQQSQLRQLEVLRTAIRVQQLMAVAETVEK